MQTRRQHEAEDAEKKGEVPLAPRVPQALPRPAALEGGGGAGRGRLRGARELGGQQGLAGVGAAAQVGEC